ncbi:GGDEF domain-containing protein, partial [[Kitasatospora] papulosa]|uniref:GGDEF domain-containing protein n=1 Tax=[Kitasatospora] papulosa TaxID=1464011 RepID=UPI0036C9396B
TALPRTALHITAMAVPLAGWTLHTTVLRRRLAQAQRDPLTGTWRREAFTARAQRLLERHPDEVVLVLADADHFKQLNDDFGHAAGDTALASIGARLTEWAGPNGVAGRLGGDEFAALARIEPRHQALRLDHLAHLTTRPVPYEDGNVLPLTVSLGAATPAAIGSSDLPTLMRAANTVIHKGKHRSTWVRPVPNTPRRPPSTAVAKGEPERQRAARPGNEHVWTANAARQTRRPVYRRDDALCVICHTPTPLHRKERPCAQSAYR